MTNSATHNLGETFQLQRKQFSVLHCDWVQAAQFTKFCLTHLLVLCDGITGFLADRKRVDATDFSMVFSTVSQMSSEQS